MADANVDSTQQAQDAQTLDNLTSLQQTDTGTTAPTGGTADATVTTTNPPAPDAPSLYNETTGTYNNQANLEAAGTNSLLDTTTFTNDGRTGAANESPTIGSGVAFGTEVNTGETQLQYTVTNENTTIQGSGTNGTQNTVGGAQGAVGAAEITTTTEAAATTTTETTTAPDADAPTTNTTPTPTLNPDGTSPADPAVDPLVIDPTPQEPVSAPISVTVKLTATVATGEDGGSITYTASLVDANDDPVTTKNAITVTLDNGETITIAANASNGNSAPVAVNRDDVYLESDSISNYITGVTEAGTSGKFESLGYDNTPVSTTINDDSDAVTVKLTATVATGEDGGSITYTASLVDANDDPVTTKNAITVTLDNGETITIAANASNGNSAPVAVNRDDVYLESDSISNYITGVTEAGTSGKFESLGYDNTPVSTTINDDSDAVTVKLTATVATGEDGGSITYTASLVDANDDPVTTKNAITVTLDNGETITIAANASNGNSAPVAVNRDDVYLESDSISNYITGVTEAGTSGKFESLGYDNTPVSTTINDDSDAVTVKLTATVATGEDGGSITYTASLVDANDDPVTTKNAITVTLDNGETITIAANASNGNSAPVAVNRDDVYLESDSISNYITGVTEAGTSGKFESLGYDNTPVSTTINDDSDAVTVKLTATVATGEDGGSITYTASLVDANDDPVTTKNAITVTLDNGETITIAANASNGNSAPVAVNRDDVYLESDSISNYITGVTEAGTSGKFESLGYDNTPVSTTINDDSDAVTVKLTATVATGEDGGSITYTASLVDANDDPVTTKNAITVTLDNGETITIAANASNGNSAPVAVNRDDVYLESDSISNYITGVTEAGTSGKFESLGYDNTPVSTTINDDSDAVTVKLTATVATGEDGGSITYTASLVDANDDPVTTKNAITVTLDNGETITIAANASNGNSAPVAVNRDDVYLESDSISNYITGVTEAGTSGKFESLGYDNTPVSTTINDDSDAVTVKLTATVATGEDGGSITYTASLVDANDDPVTTKNAITVTLDNGETITIAANASNGNSAPVAVNRDDVYLESDSISNYITGVTEAGTSGKFESLGYDNTPVSTTINDDSDAVTVKLTATVATGEDGGSITYTASLVDANDDPVTTKNAITVTLDNGETITIAANASNGNSAPVAVNRDDVYLESDSISNYITGVTEAGTSGKFESLGYDNTPVSTTINDDSDAVTVKLTATVATGEDGGSITYTASLVDANDDPVTTKNAITVTLDNGETITIAANASNGNSAPVAVNRDDVYLESDSISNYITGVTEAGTSGKFESLGYDNTPVSTTINDDSDAVTVKLTATVATGEDGGSITYTASLVDANDDPVTTKNAITVTLDNGETITIAANASNGNSAPVAVNRDDVYLESDSISNYITGVTEAGTSGKFESLGYDNTPVSTTINDDSDAVTVKLTATVATGEDGGSITYTASLVDANDDPVTTKNAITVTLDNGETITIAANASNGNSAPVAVNRDDVYLESDSISNYITGVTEAGTSGKFESLGYDNTPVSTTINDDSDAVTVKLTATVATGEDGGSITYTASLVDANDDPVTTKNAITVTLDNGETITIAANASNGNSAPVAVNRDDVYLESDSISNYITGVTEAGTSGKFESLGYDNTPVSTTINDDSDAVTVKLTATVATGEDGGSITYTASLVDANDDPVTTKNAITVTLDNGETITIAANASNGNSAPVAVNRDDVYLESDSISNYITGVTEAGTSGKFESLGYDNTPVSTTINDDSDAVTVKLTATVATGEDGGSITYTASLVDANDDPVTTKNAITVTLDNGETITIAANASNGNSAPVAVNRDDVYLESDSISNYITGVTEAGTSGKFESLGYDNTPVSTTINDDSDKTTITLLDPEPVRDGTTNVTIVAEVSNFVTRTPLVITLSNGATITIPIGEKIGVSTPFAEAVNIAPGKVSGSQEISISRVSGGNYEALDIADKATIVVQTPELTLYKTGIVTDNGGDFGVDRSGNSLTGFSGQVDSVGDVISYTLTLKNTGAVALNNVVIYDQLFKDVASINLFDSAADTTPTVLLVKSSVDVNNITSYYVELPNSLSIGEDYLIKYDYVVTLADVNKGYIENTAVIDSDLTNPLAVTDQTKDYGNTDGVAYTQVGVANLYDVAINKYANVNAVNGVGSVIEYQIYVTNEGTGALSGVKVQDEMFKTASDQDVAVGKQISAELHTLRPDGGYDVTNIFYTIGTDGMLNVGTLAYGQYAVITYEHIVSNSDYTIFQEGIQKSIFDYANIGDKVDQVEFSYGTFDAYINKVDADPYSTVVAEKAKLFFNVDNTGVAVGVNAGVMAGDRNGNSDHLRATFNPNALNGGKSVIEGVSIAFTNAKDVELAFKVTYGDPANLKIFNGSIVIGNKGSVTLREIDGTGPSSYQLNGFSTKAGSTYSFVGSDIPNGWFTVTEAAGPGGAQNKIYTLNFTPDTNFVNSFDFSVVGDAVDNSSDQIKVVDVKFDTINFTASSIDNIATVYSVEDNSADQSDEIAKNSILVTSTVGTEVGGIIDTDITAPVVSEQSFSYSENQASISTVIATVAASDNVKVSAFRFSDSKSSISADGLYQIDNSGQITLTATGLASPNNDFDVGPSAHILGVEAKDTAGNWSMAKNITLTELNLNDNLPVISDSNIASNSVSSNASIGDAVGITALAVDADVPTGSMTYSLTNDASGKFAINATTGVVTVASAIGSALNGTSQSITVNAISADGSSSSSNLTINITAPIDRESTGSIAVSTSASSKIVSFTSSFLDADSAAAGKSVSITKVQYLDATTNTVLKESIGYATYDAAPNGQTSYYSSDIKIRVFLSDGTGGVTQLETSAFKPNAATNSALTFSTSSADPLLKLTTLLAPIALDLGHDGVSYIHTSGGVKYDYNNDGIAESTAWVAPEDGLLAIQKEDGTHNIVFSTQAGETDLAGLAKVYDSNKDDVLNQSDADFAKFGVWQDADSDGIVDNGEFLSLADRGITSLSLTSDGQVHFEANGDVIVYGQTTYTTSDGQLHIAEDVGFAVSDVYEPLDIATIIANADAIESVTRIDQLAETDSSSSLFVELGGQTYEIAALAGQEAGTEDILSQFVGGDTSANLLTNKSWTDVIDISSDHGGPGSIIAAGGTLNEGNYANGEGDWTVIINSGDAKVDASNNQITFASESADNSVTIITADGASHDINNVDKIQWHG